MTKTVSFKREIMSNMSSAIERVTSALKAEGFGVLTRIDLHAKFSEKLGKEISPVVILGACNPELAYHAYQQNTDVASLLPCNSVVRDVGGGRVSVEITKPSSLMLILGDEKLVAFAREADIQLERVLEKL